MVNWLPNPRPNIAVPQPVSQVRFRDVNSEFGINNHSLLVENDHVIPQRFKNLLSTPIGSEDSLPTYGSNLPYRIMDAINETNAYLIETDTIIAVERWMSDIVRLVFPASKIIPLEAEDGYLIDLVYYSLTNGDQKRFAFEALR